MLLVAIYWRAEQPHPCKMLLMTRVMEAIRQKTMFLSRMSRLPRKPWTELDYARNMPKEYIERTKRTVPKKVFDGRFGAPAVTQWVVHPDDYEPEMDRPWTHDRVSKTIKKADSYFGSKVGNKFYELKRPKRITDDKWTIFAGDLVQVMVGKDKGRQGTVLQVSRETNQVLVDGLHTKLEQEIEGVEKMGVDKSMRWKEQPLDVSKGQVQLVDPNDSEACEAKWALNGTGDEYIRVSERSGFEIPIPSQAKVTYEYLQADKYIEVEGKDTPAAVVLERTYVPKLASFEDEIMKDLGIKENRQHKPTYWY